LEKLFSYDARTMRPSPIRELARLAEDPSIVNLAGGRPSTEAFPLEEIRGVLASLATSLPAEVLQYGRTAGDEELRAEAIGLMAERGITAADDEVILTNGSQRALDLIGRVLLDPEDVVITERPTYAGAIACFRNLRARLVGVEMDGDGVRLDRLEQVLAKLNRDGGRVKLLYLIPTFQNPSGVTLAADRRKELVAVAEREGFVILEDDPYSELFFEGEAPPRPLAALSSNVIYLSNFSKILAPGFRTAFLRGPAELIRRIEIAAQASDLSPGTLDQRLILELSRSGVLKRSIEGARAFYMRQRDILLAALEEFMPAFVEWDKPKGGFFTWLRLPKGISSKKLLDKAIDQGVAFVPVLISVLMVCAATNCAFVTRKSLRNACGKG